jgi:hypothetical protein
MLVETRQPVISHQNMTYGMGSPYQAEGVWDQNAYANIHGDRRHHVTQVYDSSVCATELKDECSDEIEAVERTVNRRDLGPSRRGAFKNVEDRVQTAQTRKDKACLRCRMQKVRVLEPPLPLYYKLLT